MDDIKPKTRIFLAEHQYFSGTRVLMRILIEHQEAGDRLGEYL